MDELRRRRAAARSRIVDELFDNPKTYLRWESEHFRLMQAVAQEPHIDSELHRLRLACFKLIHSKALFTYLRNNKVTGTDRVNVFRAYYGTLDYSNAVIAEHGRFLRATWSLMCTDHIGLNVLPDPGFINSLPDYEALYTDYVSLYCGRVIAEGRGTDYESGPLIEYMKNVALEERRKMLEPAPQRRTERRRTPRPGMNNWAGARSRLTGLLLPARPSGALVAPN